MPTDPTPLAQRLLAAARLELELFIKYDDAQDHAAEVTVVAVLRELAAAEAVDVAPRLRALADSIEKGAE